MPRQLRAAHPLIAATRTAAERLRPDETGRLRLRAPGVVDLRVSRAALTRALRVIQGLVAAAERRGWSVVPAKYGPGVAISDGQHAVGVTVTEETNRTPHIPTAREERETATKSWFTPHPFNYQPSGRLRLELPAEYTTTGSGRRRSWRDTNRRSLEEQLPAVLTELDARFEFLEQARQRRLAEQALREERAAAARSRATEAFLLDFRRAALRRQVQDRELAQQLRAVLAHVAEDDAAASPQWRETAAAYADALDPPGQRLHLPDDPVVTDSDLAPYVPSAEGGSADRMRPLCGDAAAARTGDRGHRAAIMRRRTGTRVWASVGPSTSPNSKPDEDSDAGLHSPRYAVMSGMTTRSTTGPTCQPPLDAPLRDRNASMCSATSCRPE